MRVKSRHSSTNESGPGWIRLVEVITGKEWMTDWIEAITCTIIYSSGSLVIRTGAGLSVP